MVSGAGSSVLLQAKIWFFEIISAQSCHFMQFMSFAMVDSNTIYLLPSVDIEPIYGLSKRSDRRKREIAALWLISQGHTLRVEIQRLMAENFVIDHRSGALMSVIPGLIKKGILCCERQPVPGVRKYGLLSLDAVYLSDVGQDLVKYLDWPFNETELNRMKRMHEKGKFEKKHTAAVLAFSYHARLRGWKTRVMPEIDSYNHRYSPDVIVTKGKSVLHVEVELSWKVADPKWQNMEKYLSVVAFCAKHEKHQHALALDAANSIGGNTKIFGTNLRFLFEQIQFEVFGDLWQMQQ